MKTLVTGGAGFIGSHLCDKLIEEGSSVICLDNFLVGKKENIKHLMYNEHFELRKHDVEQSFDNIECDQIYHLACPASPIHYQKEPLKTLNTIVVGTINALELARKNHARIIIASTSEVYGDPLEHPQKEEYWGNVNPIGERSCYDEGKRCAETYCYEYKNEYNMDIGVMRIFNTYGPRMSFDDGRALPTFVHQAVSGEDITIFGDGSHTRSFQYIDDLLEGLQRMMDKSGYFGPVNLGNPNEEYDMNELAKKILALSGSKSRIVYARDFPSDDPARRRPYITRAKKELGWEPQISLEEGLKKTIDWFRSKHQIPSTK